MAWVTIPGKGWCTSLQMLGSVTTYGVLGPLAPGDFIRRLTYVFSADGTTNMEIAATLGASGEASAEALAAGRPLIQRSPDVIGNVPSHEIWLVAGVPHIGWFPVGIGGTTGARYVVLALAAKVVLVNINVLVGLEVMRMRRVEDDMESAL